MREYLPLLMLAGALAAVLGCFAWPASRVRRRGTAGAAVRAAMASYDEVFRVTAHESSYEIQAQQDRKAPLLSPDDHWHPGTTATGRPPRPRPRELAAGGEGFGGCCVACGEAGGRGGAARRYPEPNGTSDRVRSALMTAPTSNAHLLPARRNRLWGAFFASLFAASLAWSLSWARAYMVNDDLPNFCDQVRRSSFPPEVACVSADGTVVGENVWWLDFLFIAAVVMTVVFAILATLKNVVEGVTAGHGPQSGSMRTALAEQVPDEAPASGDGPRRPPWVPGLVNLLVGVPAIVPLYCAQWLLTKYLPMDCRDAGDIAVATNCNYHTLDHAGPVMVALALSGAFVLALMVLVNGALPLAPGRPLRTWLGSAALIVVPYAALWGVYLSGVR